MQNHSAGISKLGYSIRKSNEEEYNRHYANHSPLYTHVKQILKDYFLELDGQPVTGLYDTVLAEVETPLLEVILEHCKTQEKAAKTLGLSRGTLRKKLRQYHFIKE
jgi:Fis family transcriptional regulator, factor for inversion stimulation protein